MQFVAAMTARNLLSLVLPLPGKRSTVKYVESCLHHCNRIANNRKHESTPIGIRNYKQTKLIQRDLYVNFTNASRSSINNTDASSMQVQRFAALHMPIFTPVRSQIMGASLLV
jgi:hypothetical protein